MYFGTHILAHIIMFGWMALSVYYFTQMWDFMIKDNPPVIARLFIVPFVILFSVVSVGMFAPVILYGAVIQFRSRYR